MIKYCLPAIIVLVGLVYFSAVKFIAPWISHAEIINAIEEACASCEIEIGHVSFALLSPLDVGVHGLKLKVGYAGGSEAIMRVDEIEVIGSFSKSSRAKIVIEKIRIIDPVISFGDGDAVTNKKRHKAEPGPIVVVENIEIIKGEFTYIRGTKGTSATLHLHDINGSLGPIESTGDEIAKAHLKNRIENSGSIEIDIAAKLKGPDHVDVSVAMREQNLADTNAFFKPNAGVTLTGILEKGRGRVRVRDQQAQASVWAVYHGLSLELSPMYDRSALMAFLTNLGAELVMADDDTDLDKKDQMQIVDVPREKDERIIGYVLRSLKEAAIKVARDAPKKK